MEVKLEPEMKILIVDDEPVVVDVISEVLESIGLSAIAAATVAEAEQAMKTEIALAIIDKNLPDGSGLVVLRGLRERWPMAEAFMLTGYASLDSAIEALRLGAADYFLKPLAHIDELKHKVRRALERRQMRREREQTLQSLKEAERLQAYANHTQLMAQLGRMLAGIVHEVRNPLTVIRSTLDLLDESRGGADLRQETLAEAIDDARLASDQLFALVVDIRRVSNVEAFDRTKRESIEVSDLVDRSVTLVRAELKNKAALELAIEPNLLVEGSPVRLTQVLINLLANAAQAMTARGQIHVRAARVGDRIRIEVEDQGTGMSPEIQARIFEPFFSTKKEGEGTGLGLGISREIVHEHGGTLTLTSTLGKGTCVVIELPAAGEARS